MSEEKEKLQPDAAERAKGGKVSEKWRREKAGSSPALRKYLSTGGWLLLAVIIVLLIFAWGGSYPGVSPAFSKDILHPGEAQPRIVIMEETGASAEKIALLKEQLGAVRRQKEESDRELREAREEVSRLEGLQGGSPDLEADLALAEEHNAILDEALQQAKREAEDREEEMNERHEELMQQDEEINDLKDTIEVLNQERADIEEGTAGLHDENAQLTNDLNKSKELIARLDEEKAALQKKLLAAGDFSPAKMAAVSEAMDIVNDLLSGKRGYSKEKDANGDGKVDVGDALYVLNKKLGE